MVTNSRPHVSLCMIVRNEELNLRACLEPVVALFDEIIVVDTGSTDRTVEIAQELGAQVSAFPWCEDFSAARNESLRKCSGNWVFWLDADDRLTAENISKLSNIIQGLDSTPQVFMMNTICGPASPTDEPYAISHARLFPKTEDVTWEGRVHEQVTPSLRRLGSKTVWTDVHILHVGYENASLTRKKLNRDIRLLQMDYATRKDDPSNLMHLGVAYFKQGNYLQSIAYLSKALQIGNSKSEWKRLAYLLSADALRYLGRANEALTTATAGIEQYPDDDELLLKQAELFMESGDFIRSEQSLRYLLSLPEGNRCYSFSHLAIRSKIALGVLTEVLRLQGRLVEAEQNAISLLLKHPDYTYAWVYLGTLYAEQKNWPRLEQVVKQLANSPHGVFYANCLTAKMLIGKGQLVPARELLEQVIADRPQVPWPKMLLGDLLMSTHADPMECIALFRGVLRLDPGNLAAKSTIAYLENETLRRSRNSNPAIDWHSVVVGTGFETRVAWA